ncbi:MULTISPECIES: glycoside hydrolase family 27 protein [unclassified Gordonia (in: high G+C Gram-positive bacteria)]|uniref:glycoside hydrolase family 27 protein n=1 Tax=unclassified Gordonia (in: high G+C Gram-positive bacteria) TaxID=2657482 RepID=UPI0018D494A1
MAVIAALAAVACTPQQEGRIGGDGPAIPGLAAVPPMGWNSWNTFGCGITEQIVRAQADALVSSGLRDAGYKYVIVDDCWAAPQRDASGRLQADPVRFSSGMAALGVYLHERGLLFGIYSGARDKTCTQYQGTYPGATGSGGHEVIDAQTFAGWGVDYLKYDWCSSNTSHDDQVSSFTAMRNALRDTGRRIVFAINPNSGVAGSVPGAQFDWGGTATTTRVTNDVTPAWSTANGPSGYQGIVNIVDAAGPLTARVKPGSFIDSDMLVVGSSGLTAAEQRTQMSMWSMMAAPLIAGNDLTNMSQETLDMLRNAAIIAIDQDSRVVAGAMVDDDPEVWSRAIGDKGLVISLTNRSDHARTLSVSLGSVGLVGDASVTGVDAWTGRSFTAQHGELSVPVGVHDTAVLEIR